MAAPPPTGFERFQVVGTTPHRHEQEGIDWLRSALGTYGPWGGYALFSFNTEDGRRYEVDAIALTTHCLFVLELKAWQGRLIEGDIRYLVTHSARRGREVVDHPLPLLETKAKSFMARVRTVARRLGRDVEDELTRLRFEPLVWLTHAEGTDLSPGDAALAHVLVGRQTLSDALRQASFPGARDDLKTRKTEHKTLLALQKVLRSDAFGLASINKPPTILDGQYALKQLIEEGENYQDHWAEPHGVGPRCRVRSYLAPKSDRAFVEQLDKRVEREAKTLIRLGEHTQILPLLKFDPKGPLGPALVFRDFDGVSLEAFMKKERDEHGKSTVNLEDKLAILRAVADALAFCHRSDVVHGAVSPHAVLVRRVSPTGRPDVRLTRFALAKTTDPTSEGTRLFTRLAGGSANLYEAPEIARGVAPSPASDIFSLGALAYYLLAEEPPASTPTELAQRLENDGGLRISTVRDDLFPSSSKQGIDHVLLWATSADPVKRASDFESPLAFVDLLEEALTAPDTESAPPEPEIPAERDPVEAKKGDRFGDLEVVSCLGSGATARVFKVVHPELGPVALKVPLSEAQDERIAREGDVLARLRNTAGVDRVAHIVEKRTIGGRTCLLVQFAGDRTLADQIRAEGPLSLDYARRWGEDLLLALRSLEEAGVQHRDIKPANIGLTSIDKKKIRLLLFDFSLSDRPADHIEIGTPAYKDPELTKRGRWDDAADRWAAAITLYEMFTGSRPAPVPSLAAGKPAVRIEPERFDADVRESLARFFDRALRAKAPERFATADDMRDDFLRALHNVGHDAIVTEDLPVDLRGLGPETPVASLPLSTRARNALDRLGIYTLHDVAQLSANRVTGVRGVGAQTAKRLVELAASVRQHLQDSEASSPPPFFRGFNGACRELEAESTAGRLSAELVTRLVDAGIADTATLAAAPVAQVRNLVGRARRDGAAETTKALTEYLDGLVDTGKPPATLGAAVELLAPKLGSKGPAWRQRVRIYLGLEDREGFRRHGTMVELARAEDKTPALISIDLGNARKAWFGDDQLSVHGAEPATTREAAVLKRAFDAVFDVLAKSAGVVPLATASAAVLDAFPPEPDLDATAIRGSTEALVRAVTEVEARLLGGPDDVRLRFRRVTTRPDEVLVSLDKSAVELAQRLGRAADELVAAENVASEATAAARLRQTVDEATDLPEDRAAQVKALPDRPLVGLASATAERARVSARGELYPAGLSAERATLLTAAAIAGVTKFDELQRRVRARYPESAPMPDAPEAREALAKKLNLRFDPAQDALVPLERTTGSSTELASARTHLHAMAPAEPAADASVALDRGSAPNPAAGAFNPPRERPRHDVLGATALRVFDEELERARHDGGFRVLLWRGETDGAHTRRGAPDAEYVARAVAKRIDAEHARADALLIRSAEIAAEEKRILGGLAPAIEADGAGPESEDWSLLLQLFAAAAERFGRDVLAMERPLVLTRLGLLARYDQLEVVERIAIAHRNNAAAKARPARFIVLPVFPGEGAVVEVGADVAPAVGAAAGTCLVPVPGLLANEILTVPESWMRKQATARRTSAPHFPAQRP